MSYITLLMMYRSYSAKLERILRLVLLALKILKKILDLFS